MYRAIAQDAVRQRLQQFIAARRLPHALLFCGPEGCGKLAMAVEFAVDLVKLDADERGKRMADALQHPDLHFVFPVYKPEGSSSAPTSELFMAEWRDAIRNSCYFDLPAWVGQLTKEAKKVQIYAEESARIVHKLNLMSSQGGYKVMVIWLPEFMHESCANKILKILEEPPQHTVFILVSEHPERLLDTIVSRCQRIDFKGLADAEIEEALCAQRGLDPSMARTIAHSAAGSYTRALQLISVSADEALFFSMFVLFMRKCYLRDIREMRDWARQVSEWGRERQKDFLAYCQRLIRENFMYNFHRPELNYLSEQENQFSVNFARFVNERNVIPIMDELSQAQRDIEQNTNSQMVFFDFALRMIVLLIQ